jgi:hypothetical protein
MFENEDYDNTIATRKLSVRGCHISLLAACTLDTFGEMWGSEFTSIGFINRIFLVHGSPRNRISLPKPPPANQISDLRQRTFALVEQVKSKRTNSCLNIGLSPDATSQWDDYYCGAMPRGIHAGRLDTYAFKWMMLLSLSQEEFEISRRTVERTIELIEYQSRIRELYSPIDANNDYARMEEKIRRIVRNATPSRVTRRNLQQLTNANRDGIHFFESAITNLLRSNEIKLDGPKGWKWNPESEP